MKAILTDNPLLLTFLIAALGYAVGRIRVCGISIGAAGILLMALVFGHFGFEVPAILQNLGLLCFVTAVGFIAGPVFFSNFRGNVKAYVITGILVILSGEIVCAVVIRFAGVPADLGLGLLTGALTTTPGLAAALEATGSDLVSVGYGIAYPFGVVSVVLFVQLLPHLLHADMAQERILLEKNIRKEERPRQEKLLKFDSYGLFSFSIAIMLGILIGMIRIPLPGGAVFSLGTSGGPLVAGLVLGHFQTVWIFDFDIERATLTSMRELGLMLFLLGAGTHAGAGFVQVLMTHGPVLFLYGALMALVPLIVGYAILRGLFHINLLDALGSVCGGMTSTPALGTLIQTAGTDDVAASYAATYPVALAVIVLSMQVMGQIFWRG